MNCCFFLAVFLSVTATRSIVDYKNDHLDQYLEELLELLKSKMQDGFPDFGIPTLDPQNGVRLRCTLTILLGALERY